MEASIGKEDPIMWVEDIAEHQRRTVAALYCERSKGEGPPFIRFGRRLGIHKSAYFAWLDSRVESGK